MLVESDLVTLSSHELRGILLHAVTTLALWYLWCASLEKHNY